MFASIASSWAKGSASSEPRAQSPTPSTTLNLPPALPSGGPNTRSSSGRPLSPRDRPPLPQPIPTLPPPVPPGSPRAAEADLLRTIAALKNEVAIRDSLVDSLKAKISRLEDDLLNQQAAAATAAQQAAAEAAAAAATASTSPPESASASAKAAVERRKHDIQAVSHTITDTGRVERKMGTRGSIATANVLEALDATAKSREQTLAERFLRVFEAPDEYVDYLSSAEFCDDLVLVCQAASALFEAEPRCAFLQSPVYVIGDIHGNLEDLHFFADNVWKLGMDLTAGKFLFLGDYVDRGLSSLECVAYLFGLKLLYPNKVILLRGNHETRDVNGWEDHYKEQSFLYQCKMRFGADKGEEIWEECNLAFDRMPLSAVIDHEIFCIHGGIPRPVPEHESEIQAILSVPCVASVMPPYDHESEWSKQVCSDCIWSDPASDDMERTLDATGFGDSPRGGGAVCFGHAAIDNFLAHNELSYIIRAHEAHAHGVSLSKGARVFTVFSTSKDHRQGAKAMAGCILVDFDKIQVINRSPKYKNKYVHRRSSVSLQDLSPEEISQRQMLGLVRLSMSLPVRSRGGNDDDAGGTNSTHFPAFG